MRQEIDVLAIFDAGVQTPRPIRFKMLEQGIKTTVRISEIQNTEWIGAGGMMHIEYECATVNDGRRIKYKLLFFPRDCRWEIDSD